MNQLALGVTIAMRDAFSAKARSISRGFSNLDDIAYRAARGVSRSADLIEAEVFNITRTFAGAFVALGAVAYPTKKAMEFAEGLAEVATIADYTRTNMKELREEVLRQSFVYPTSAKQQVESLYQTVSSGFINTADALTVLEQATRLGVTTLTDTPQTLRALTGVLNAYSEQFKAAGTTAVEQADLVSAKLFETTRWGRIRMDELGKYVGYGASASAIGGVGMDSMLASVAAMTLGSLSPEQAFQYYRQLVLGTIKPTVQSAGIAKKYGITMGKEGIAAFGGDWNLWLKNAYEVIAVQNNNLADFAKLLSGRQAFAGAATLLNQWDMVVNAQKSIASPWVVDEWGAVITSQERAFRMMEKTLGYQVKQMVGAWETMFISLGNYSEHFFTPLVKGMNGVLGVAVKLVDTSPFLQQAFLGAGLSAAFALGMFGLLQIRLLKQGPAWRELQEAARLTRFQLWGMNLTAGQAVRTFGGLFMVISLGVYAIKKAYDTNFRGFGDFVNKWMTLFSALGGMTRQGADYFMPAQVWEQIEANGWGPLFQSLVRFRFRVETFLYSVGAGIRGFFTGLKDAAVGAIDWVANIVANFSSAHADKIRALKDFFNNFSMSDPEAWAKVGRTVGGIVGAVVVLTTAMLTWRTMFAGLRGVLAALLLPLRLVRGIIGVPGRVANGAAAMYGAGKSRAGGLLARARSFLYGGGYRLGGAALGGAAGVAGASSVAESLGTDVVNVRAPNAVVNIRYADVNMGGPRRGGGGGTAGGILPGVGGRAPRDPKGRVFYDRASRSMRDSTGKFVKNSAAGFLASAHRSIHLFFVDKIGPLVTRFVPAIIRQGLSRVAMGVVTFFSGPVGWAVAAGIAALSLFAWKGDSILAYMQRRMPTWYGLFGGALTAVTNFASGAWGAVKSVIGGVWGVTKSVVGGINNLLGGALSWLWSNIATGFSNMLDRVALNWNLWKERHPTLVKLAVEAGNAVSDFARWVVPGGSSAGSSEADLVRKHISLLPNAPSWAVDPALRAQYQAGNNYARGYGYGNSTDLRRNQLAFLAQNGIKLPIDPTANLNVNRLAQPQLVELQSSLRSFLASSHAQEIESRMWRGGAFIGAMRNVLKRVDDKLTGNANAPFSGDPGELYDSLVGPNGLGAAVEKGARDGILDAERMMAGRGVYESEEYRALWQQRVEDPFRQFYGAYSGTLAGGVRAGERGSGADGNNIQQIVDEVKALTEDVRSLAAKATGKIDVILNGRKVGEGVRQENTLHERDHSVRKGVTQAPTRLNF